MLSSTQAFLPFFTWLVFFINIPPCTLSADSEITVAGLFCGNSTPPPTTSIIPTFAREMEALLQLVNVHRWGHHQTKTNSTAFPPVYALSQCFQHISKADCILCHSQSCVTLSRCLPVTSGRVFFDGCFLRYDNYSFFNESVDPNRDTVKCSGASATKLGFQKDVGELMQNVTESAMAKGGFAVVEGEGVYALAQCWKSVSSAGCRDCLEKARKEVKGCLPSKEGRGLNAGCYLRYSTEKFFSNDKGEKKKSGLFTLGEKVAIALGSLAFLLLSFFAAYATYARLSKLKEERSNLGHISGSARILSLMYKYETLEKATNYFDISRKLGQGGAGSVFRGTLPKGKNVAVKRLFYNTRQWVDEFFNEVNLISGIQHKNLVKLLGCSIEGPESLLVYEYVPNKSLDQFLFDKNKVQILNWKERFEIIVGTAEGLAHLHGGSQKRIIHRDIKSSNVLLDENLAPKISDFGLARCFAADKTHLSTGIAGTLGYMAPEYLVRGQLTEKADVYSFGILVLEIVCGTKNNAVTEDSGSLLQTVWIFYKVDKLIELVDPCLKGNFPAEEAFKVLAIALLCTQASAALRPAMSEVVQMLTDKDCEIPMPHQPPFLNARVLGPANSGRALSVDSMITNLLTKVEVFCSSSESSDIQSSDGPPNSDVITNLLTKVEVFCSSSGSSDIQSSGPPNSYDLKDK